MKASIQIAAAATLLLATGAYAQNLGTMEYVGCYSSSIGLTLTNTSKFQTQGSCQPDCVNDGNQLVLGLTKRFECWCGMTLPPVDTKASNSSCSATCGGFNAPCGSEDGKFFTVYTSGVTDVSNIKNATDAVSTSSASTSAPSGTGSTTTSASPSVITVGNTIITVTASAQAAADSAAADKKSSKASPTGIIAGVVVGIVLVGALAGGAFLFLRQRHRKQIEEEYQRNANINSFVANGKPPGSSAGFSNITDTRLDHSALQRRMSDGSIADNEDYSRKILRVTNA